MTEHAGWGASDATLVDRAVAGDEAAFSALVAAHSRSMARLSFAICGDTEMARDAVQAAWVVAWAKLASVRERQHVRSWLLTVAANEARRLARRERHRVHAEQRAAARAREPTPVDAADFADLARLLDQLALEERELLGLRYGLGFTSQEIAARLGSSPNAVRVRLTRLLQRLREELDRA